MPRVRRHLRKGAPVREHLRLGIAAAPIFDDRRPILGNCASCGFHRPLRREPDGTYVCDDCWTERSG